MVEGYFRNGIALLRESRISYISQVKWHENVITSIQRRRSQVLVNSWVIPLRLLLLWSEYPGGQRHVLPATKGTTYSSCLNNTYTTITALGDASDSCSYVCNIYVRRCLVKLGCCIFDMDSEHYTKLPTINYHVP